LRDSISSLRLSILSQPKNEYQQISFSSPWRLLASSIIPLAVVTTPETALATKSPSQLAQLAIPVTVQINSELGGGSGVIIDQTTIGAETTYFVLTANHIVENSQLPYEISTYTGETYIVSSIKQYRETENDPELAVITFQTQDYYPVAAMGNSSETELGATIAIFGYPDLGLGLTGSARPFIYSPGQIENLQEKFTGKFRARNKPKLLLELRGSHSQWHGRRSRF